MIASGLKTAPPQVIPEAVLVTNSACLSSLEASHVSPALIRFNPYASSPDALWTQSAADSCMQLHPSVDSASRFRTLSATPVSGA